ncbi:hypothetical protein DN37_2927 [Vibrio cholerae]|nr:hypothetical protein DN37_2927 [Vibrio cholerae]
MRIEYQFLRRLACKEPDRKIQKLCVMLPFPIRNTTVICTKFCKFSTYVRVLQFCAHPVLIHVRVGVFLLTWGKDSQTDAFCRLTGAIFVAARPQAPRNAGLDGSKHQHPQNVHAIYPPPDPRSDVLPATKCCHLIPNGAE